MATTPRTRYLVTGGAGFIGSHLCEVLLSSGGSVTVVDDLSTGRESNLDAARSAHGDCLTFVQATVTDALAGLPAGGFDGIFHLAGLSRVSRFEMGQTIARRFGFPQDLIKDQGLVTTPGRAPRPRDVSLDNRQTRAQLKTPMRTLDEGLSLILETAKSTIL